MQKNQKCIRVVLRVEDLTDVDLAAIAASEPPAWAKHLDSEIDSGSETPNHSDSS